MKISDACLPFVLCLDYVAISPFIYFKDFDKGNSRTESIEIEDCAKDGGEEFFTEMLCVL